MHGGLKKFYGGIKQTMGKGWGGAMIIDNYSYK
jgi:hypothetical protein